MMILMRRRQESVDRRRRRDVAANRWLHRHFAEEGASFSSVCHRCGFDSSSFPPQRSEEGQIVSEDDMDVGNVVSGGVVRGQAQKGQTSSTTSGVGGRAGQMDISGGAQRGVMMSGGFQAT